MLDDVCIISELARFTIRLGQRLLDVVSKRACVYRAHSVGTQASSGREDFLQPYCELPTSLC